MNNSKKVYTIVYASNNNFVPLLSASIKSLELNSPGSIKDIYIISDGITKRNWKRLTESHTSDDIILRKISHQEILTKGLQIPYFNNSYLPVTVFFRLFIERFLPEKTVKVLYLDADTILLEDLASLWETDLRDHILGAVQDLSIKTFDCPWGGVRNHESLGYAGNTKYFNSGVMLINFKLWKEFRVLDKVMKAARENKKYILYADQYCLNVVLAGKWMPLDPLWNHPVDYFLIDSNYQPEPYLLHFTGTKPIYTNYAYSEKFRAMFYNYLNKTNWNNISPKGKLEQKFTAIKNILRKILT